MSQHAWVFVTVAVGALMVTTAAAHDKGRPWLAPVVWVLAAGTLASIFPMALALD